MNERIERELESTREWLKEQSDEWVDSQMQSVQEALDHEFSQWVEEQREEWLPAKLDEAREGFRSQQAEWIEDELKARRYELEYDDSETA